MQTDYALSARRADRVLGLSRSARHYRPRPRDDGPIIDATQKHLEVDPRHGFSLLFGQTLKPRGFGKTRSWRVYCALRLNLPRRGKRRLPERVREPVRWHPGKGVEGRGIRRPLPGAPHHVCDSPGTRTGPARPVRPRR